jgi:uncharacterized protein (TIGR00159 family)
MLDLVLAQVRELHLADLLDIVLVTTFVYSAITLLRHTQARLVAGGIVVLMTLYIVAQALDLRLTTWLLQGFFAVFLIILVVIFQEELRQLFERLALWGLRRNVPATPSFGTADLLVGTAADLARSRTGALIVLVGAQPIERHLHGGIELNGRLSEPLLKSIFDTHSPGHDGAVVISKDTVVRFAAQLPLSTDFKQLRGTGTRHSAALGLAERTDALCIVVSEERGAISVARNSRIQTLDGAAQLEAELQSFMRELTPPATRRGVLSSLLRENWVEKIASLAFVLGLWFLFVPGSRPATRAFPIAVKVVNVPPGSTLEHVDPAQVTAILSGQRRAFYLFNPDLMDVTIDATLAKYGRRTFAVSEDQIRHPPELTVEDVEPEQVRISLRADGGTTATETSQPPAPTPSPHPKSGG